MKIDRLISIIMVLLERKIVSATKLAEMFEVTPRTIYRDIETISLAGIPIVTSSGVNGGISIMEKYKVDKKLFNESDIITLLTGLSSISSTLSTNTLVKVKSLIPEEKIKQIELKSNQISIDFSSWVGNRNLQPNIEIIKEALDANRLVAFEYSDGYLNKSQREVEPYRLVLKEGKWYLQAYCLNRQDFRNFKLARISALKRLDVTFNPREQQIKPLSYTSWVDERLIMIKLLVDKTLKEQVMEHCGEENIQDCGNNQLLVNLPFLPDEYGYRILLSFGDRCECLAPENVRNELIKRVEKLFSVYH